MLGKGAPLPGACAWAGATVESTRVLSWYSCAGQRVDLELRHPDDAVEAAARTARFALRVRHGTAPPGLVDALAARFREREAAFRWRRPTAARVALPSGDDRPLRALGMALAAVLLLALPMRWTYQRLARRAAAPATRAAAIAGTVLAIALAAGVAAAGRAAALAFGQAALATLGRTPAAGIAAALGAMIAWLALALGAAVLAARAPARISARARLAIGAALYVALTYPMSLRGPALTHFGRVVPGRPNLVTPDFAPGRPSITYRYNARGFREPDWDLDKAPGVTRVAILGDSYVQGVGVELYDTLSENLGPELGRRLPERRFEVINLGVPGDNLSSHVDLYEAAQRLDPDVVVLCLTLPNDLSRWDLQAQLREAGRPSVFSFARYLFGEAAGAFWDAALLEHTITPAGLAHLEREVARLAAMRASAPRPGLVVFSFREGGPAVTARLAPLADARVVPEGETEQDDFFRGDGHPTGAGNLKFARWIAAAVEAELRARR
ncbi:MAG: SGNH/GDSL hydrolase family protein [Minicystis sp.]